MKLLGKILVVITMLGAAGCCISSRSWRIDKEIPRYTPVGSGTYVTYASIETKTETVKYYDGRTETREVPKDYILKYCNYHTGPWEGSDIYPATRLTLNALSGWSYSSPASGDYMLNIVTVPLYPLVLCNLPIQFVLDTVLLPWDLISAPTCPEGYKLSH